MRTGWLSLLARLLPGALLAPILIFLGIGWRGADAVTEGLLFALSFLVVAALAALLAPRTLLVHFFRTNRLSIGAGLALFAFSLAAGAPLPERFAATLGYPPEVANSVAAISVAPTSSLLAALIGLAPLAAFGLGALTGASERARTVALRVMIALAIALGAYALFDYTRVRVHRLDVGLPSSNAAAVLFGALAVLSLALMMRAMRRSLASMSGTLGLPRSLAGAYAIINAPLSAIATCLSLLCLLLTGSRGGVIVTALGLTVFISAILTLRGKRDKGRALAKPAIWGAACALALLSAFAAAPVLARLDAGLSSIAGRSQIAAAHWAIFLDHPWLGHGTGSYHTNNLSAMTTDNFEALRNAGAAHNIYLQALEELGIIGVALLALALATPLWRASQAFVTSANASEWRPAALAISIILLGQGAFDFGVQIPALAALYAYCLGLLTQPRALARSIVPAYARSRRDTRAIV